MIRVLSRLELVEAYVRQRGLASTLEVAAACEIDRVTAWKDLTGLWPTVRPMGGLEVDERGRKHRIWQWRG